MTLMLSVSVFTKLQTVSKMAENNIKFTSSPHSLTSLVFSAKERHTEPTGDEREHQKFLTYKQYPIRWSEDYHSHSVNLHITNRIF